MSPLKTLGVFFAFGPPIYGFIFGCVATIAAVVYGERIEISSLLSPLALSLATTFVFWASLSPGDAIGIQYLIAPTCLAGALFWWIAKLMYQRLAWRSEWQCKVLSGVLTSFIGIFTDILWNIKSRAISWDNLYFYRVGDRSVPDYSEWGFMDAYGPVFYLTVLILAAFVLGAICSPKPIEPDDQRNVSGV
jgi:hypothetical protein